MILRITQALLTLAGDPHAEFIAGDLYEEFLLIRPTLGPCGAARWHAWQLVRSLSWPLSRRLLHLTLVMALPLFVLDRMWAVFFEQLCLVPADGLLLANGGCLFAGVLLTRPSCRIATMGLLASGLATGLTVGAPAFPHIFAGLLAVPAGIFAAQIATARG